MLLRVAVTTMLLLAVSTNNRSAQATLFTIDITSSYLQADGSSFLIFSEQSLGSLYTRLSGGFVADIEGDTVSLPGGSHVVAETREGSFTPFDEPANIAARAYSFSAGLWRFAIRDATFDIVGDSQTIGDDGRYPSNAWINFTGGTLDYHELVTSPESVPLILAAPLGLDASSPTQSWIERTGDEVRIIQYFALRAQFPLNDDEEGFVRFKGRIVASAVVPEPESLALCATASLIVSAAFGWRRFTASSRTRRSSSRRCPG
jgi:hypothetical protein